MKTPKKTTLKADQNSDKETPAKTAQTEQPKETVLAPNQGNAPESADHQKSEQDAVTPPSEDDNPENQTQETGQQEAAPKAPTSPFVVTSAITENDIRAGQIIYLTKDEAKSDPFKGKLRPATARDLAIAGIA